MNAVTFFKSMGLKAVKQYLENDNIRTKEMHDELKQIVDAFELVERFGGLKSSIETYNCFKNACDEVGIKHSPKMVILKQAINLVEQCNA